MELPVRLEACVHAAVHATTCTAPHAQHQVANRLIKQKRQSNVKMSLGQRLAGLGCEERSAAGSRLKPDGLIHASVTVHKNVLLCKTWGVGGVLAQRSSCSIGDELNNESVTKGSKRRLVCSFTL